MPGPPVQFGPPVTNANVKAGYGFIPNGVEEKNLYYYHPDHLGSSSYITDKNGEVIQHTEYIAFGETFVDEHSTSNKMPYLFNGKELDYETGLYYYGARYYDPKVSIFLNVDPLAEKYPEVSPYIYTLNNPIMLIDPDGRDILPVLINSIKSTSSKNIAIRKEYRSHPSFIKAMTDFGKTTYGKEFIGNFLNKGEHQYGVKGNGKYSKYTLELKQFNLPDGQMQYDAMSGGAEGYFHAKEVNGKLHIIMAIDIGVTDVQALAETITHELALHGYKVDEYIKAYEKGGIDAVNKIIDKDPGGEKDHKALHNNDMKHKGVQKYNQVKKELIKF